MGFLSSKTDEIKPLVTANQIAVDPGLLAQQQSFAQALQQQVSGNGPSVAGAMLNNSNQQNSANALGMAASQRGVNPGLAMRQALQANANANQNTAAQAVVGRNQEQLNATSQLGGQLNAMQGQNLHAQQANQTANLGASNINAGIAQGNTHDSNGLIGGLMNGAGSAAAAMALSKGGVVQNFDDGGFVDPMSYAHWNNPDLKVSSPSSPSKVPSTEPAHTDVVAYTGPNQAGPDAPISGGMSPGDSMFASNGAVVPGHAATQGDDIKNDTVPTMLSPGEVVIPRSVVQSPGFMEALQHHVAKMHGEAKGFAQVLAARKGRA